MGKFIFGLGNSLDKEVERLIKLEDRTRGLFGVSSHLVEGIDTEVGCNLNPKYEHELKETVGAIYSLLTSQTPEHSYALPSPRFSFGNVITKRPDLVALKINERPYESKEFFGTGIEGIRNLQRFPNLTNVWRLFIPGVITTEGNERVIVSMQLRGDSTDFLMNHSIGNTDRGFKFYKDSERLKAYFNGCSNESLFFVSTERERTREWVEKVHAVYESLKTGEKEVSKARPLLGLEGLDEDIKRDLTPLEEGFRKNLVRRGKEIIRKVEVERAKKLEEALTSLQEHYAQYHLK
jgi:hypothetical protein